MKFIERILKKIDEQRNCAPEDGVTLEPQPVISFDEVEAVENELGVAFPEIIKRIYCEVGNGGFGPGYGILGLVNGWRGADETADALYKQFCLPDDEDSLWQWPRQLIPYCYWGCTIYSCLDCSREVIVTCDTSWRSFDDPIDNIFFKKTFGIEEWFEMWINDIDIFEELTKWE